MNEENSPGLNLNGHLLTIGSKGINAYYNEYRPYIEGGEITAAHSFLTIKTGTYGSSQIDYQGRPVVLRLSLYSVIRDHKDHQVGLLITGSHPAGESGQVNLMGDKANTFTGDVVVEGARNTLHLHKKDGVTAIRGNVVVRQKAGMNIVGSDQISDSSMVTLLGGAMLSFSSTLKVIREKIHALVLEKGENRLMFYHSEGADSFQKTLLLDDLIIRDDAFLRISGWEAGRDHLLVRKDSEHLSDSLRKIRVDGWGQNQVYLKDYDKEYWSIEAAPEPTTYGAIVTIAGLGLFMYRRRAAKVASRSS